MRFWVHIFIFIFVVLTGGCSSKGTVNVGNPDAGSGTSIQMGKLTADGRSNMTIPEEVFGGASHIDSSTFLIQVNEETQTAELSASTYYQASTGVVTLTLSNLENGDVVTFIIFRNDVQTAVYSGAVSTSQDTEAVVTTSSVRGIFDVDEAQDTCTTDGNPATSDFGLADSTDRDELCLQITASGDFIALEFDDDNTEVITALSGRTFEVTYEATLEADVDFNCEFTYSTDGETVTGLCTLGSNSCVLAYTKTGDDPFDGCNNPDDFIDAR